MSVGRVTITGKNKYALVDFGREDLNLRDLAEFISMGHEIQVFDDKGVDLTKETLVKIAIDSVRDIVSDENQASKKLMSQDNFRLHQLIEDSEVKSVISE